MSIKVEVHLIRTTPGSVDKNESPPSIEDSVFENGENIDKHAFIQEVSLSLIHRILILDIKMMSVGVAYLLCIT